MALRAIVSKGVTRALGACGLSREGLIRVLARLHSDLASQPDRSERDLSDPDCFLYRIILNDGGRRHDLAFQVNDAQAPGFLFVEGLTHEAEGG